LSIKVAAIHQLYMQEPGVSPITALRKKRVVGPIAFTIDLGYH
jgi:hypothetical protein